MILASSHLSKSVVFAQLYSADFSRDHRNSSLIVSLNTMAGSILAVMLPHHLTSVVNKV